MFGANAFGWAYFGQGYVKTTIVTAATTYIAQPPIVIGG